MVTLTEFAELCKNCNPALKPIEATALLQRAAKVAIDADTLKRKYAELEKKHAELGKNYAELKQNEADTKLRQAEEIISRAIGLADKIISAAEKPKPDKKPKKEQAERKKYGEYKHVLLTDEQYKKLITAFGAEKAADGIKNVDEYCQQSGKRYADYYLAVRNFIRGDIKKSDTSEKPKQEHSYNLDTLIQHAMNNPPKIK